MGVLFAVSIGMFVLNQVIVGALGIIFAVFVAVYYNMIRPRLEFAAANLKIASLAIMATPTVFLYTFLVLAIHLMFCLVWFVAAFGVATNLADPHVKGSGDNVYSADVCTTYEYSTTVNIAGMQQTCPTGTCKICICDDGTNPSEIISYGHNCFNTHLQYGRLFAMLLSFFWTSSVMSNIVHCTSAGATASWWFSQTTNKAWVGAAFLRAWTTSLGSISLGSLFIAVIRTMRWFFAICSDSFKYPSENASVNRLKNIMYSIFESCLGLLEQMMTFFSKYALCYVAIYGDGFIEASRSVATLFNQKGWTALVNDDIIDSMLFCCNMSVGVICMSVGYLYGSGVGLENSNRTLLSAFGLVGGGMMSMVVSRIMSSAVATVFVCFAEDHSALEVTHPEEYKMLSDAWIDCNCHPAVCTGIDNEAASSTSNDASLPKSYIANRGTYKPPGELSVPSAVDDGAKPSSRNPSYEYFSRQSNSFRRDSDDEETVTF